MDLQFGSSKGDQADLALMTRPSTAAETIKFSGTLDNDTNWASNVLIMNGSVGETKPTPAPTAAPTPLPTAAPTPPPTAPPVGGTAPVGIWISKDEIRRQSTSGGHWDAVYSVARTYEYLWYVREETGDTVWFDGKRADETTDIVNKYYGLNYPVQSKIGGGRTFGFTGFTHPTRESLMR